MFDDEQSVAFDVSEHLSRRSADDHQSTSAIGHESSHRRNMEESLSLLLCLSQAVNGPLQERTPLLRSDSIAEDLYFQETLASRVSKETTEVFDLLTRALRIHLNVNQSFQLNSSAVFVIVETVKIDSLMDKEIRSVAEARVRFPHHSLDGANLNQYYSLRVRSLLFIELEGRFFSLVNCRTVGSF